MRKWREIHSLHFLILSLFPPSLSISSIKICHILSQNINYGTYVSNGTKNLTYALWGNNSGSKSLQRRSASCAGLVPGTFFCTKRYVWVEGWKEWFGIRFPAEGDQILALDQLLATLECFPINENIQIQNLFPYRWKYSGPKLICL